MSDDIAPPSSFVAWGPFVRDNYEVLPVTRSDLIVAATTFGLAMFFGLTAAFIGFRHTKASRRPWRCAYIWMIWLELAASVALAIICLLYLLWIIRPSFYFYMACLLCWVVQIQLLPQIIVNRICIILQDKRKGRRLIILTATVITTINISVFCIWIPARLQISERWIRINAIWDRIEKVLFLLLDGYLNWYFIRVVTAELVRNGLTKYNRLVRFNKRMIVVSLLFDVMIIGAMSIPNGFVYAMFHPLAYIAKLNIEMSMAHLIRVIALDHRNSNQETSLFVASASSPEQTTLNNTLFSEVRMPRRAFLQGLFSSDPIAFARQHARDRAPGLSSTQSTTITDYEMKSLERKSSRRSCYGKDDDRNLHEPEQDFPIHRENIDEEMEISHHVQDIRTPDQVALTSRVRDTG